MKKIILGILVWVFIVLLGCFIAWLGGYNFDKRSPEIAYNFSMLLIVSILPAVGIFLTPD